MKKYNRKFTILIKDFFTPDKNVEILQDTEFQINFALNMRF